MQHDIHYIRDEDGNVILEEHRPQHPILKLVLFFFVADMLRFPMGVSFVTSACILLAGAVAVRMMPIAWDYYQEWRDSTG